MVVWLAEVVIPSERKFVRMESRTSLITAHCKQPSATRLEQRFVSLFMAEAHTRTGSSSLVFGEVFRVAFEERRDVIRDEIDFSADLLRFSGEKATHAEV